MLIDRTHRNWAVLTIVLLVVATILYVVYARTWPGGPSGRTRPGMLFGVAAALLMLFAAALSIRKKTVRLRLGSLSWWLRGHVWLALLSLPLVFYHAAFRWGGTLEWLLWITLAIVTASGFVGLALQNILPRMMKIELPSEAIPDQLAEICRRLVRAADDEVTALCTPPVVEESICSSPVRIGSAHADPRTWLASFHVHTIRPFLASGHSPDTPLAEAQGAQMMFARIRSTLPDDYHATVTSLERLADERRHLTEQERLYRLLHGWLKIHVPCSVVLLMFLAMHVVTTLYY